METLAELEAAAKLPGSSAIEDVDAPGGGKRVRVKGPDGHRIDLVQGQTPAEPMNDVRGPLKVNYAQEKSRLRASAPGHGARARVPHRPLRVQGVERR